MKLIQRFLDRLPRHVIVPDCPGGKVGAPLMTRYFLFQRDWLAVYIHHFHRSDLDEFHDHPWNFVAFLFHRGYWEHVPPTYTLRDGPLSFRVGHQTTCRNWRHRFSVLWRPATFQHYVEIDIPTWTFVIRFRRSREWGYITNGVWTHWRVFDKELKSRSICEDAPDRGSA